MTIDTQTLETIIKLWLLGGTFMFLAIWALMYGSGNH